MEEKKGMGEDSYLLITKGKPLGEWHILRDYNIKHEDALHLVPFKISGFVMF